MLALPQAGGKGHGRFRTFAIGALVRKRAELAGLIERHRAELQAMVANLGHLDATLRLFDPEIRLDAIRPKASRPAADPGRPEITTRMMLDALRRAGAPLTAREVAAWLLALSWGRMVATRGSCGPLASVLARHWGASAGRAGRGPCGTTGRRCCGSLRRNRPGLPC